MLKEECIQSAQFYLDYLEAHKDEGCGIVRATVKNIIGSMLDDKEITLFTDRVIRSGEGLAIRIGGTLYENTPELVYFKVLSINRKKIVIEPSADLAEYMESARNNKEKIILESDLTFLVKRVKTWYEKYGDMVSLPSVKPYCKMNPDNPIALSDNQYECASLAMSSPLTYIWGAPGTGKTKHVLASCVMNYLNARKKVILAAPTNNALEQSLSGLLQTLPIEPSGKIIRLGTPGDAFRTIFPTVHEEGAIKWLTEDIRGKLDKLNDQLNQINISITCKEAGKNCIDQDPYPEKKLEDLLSEKKQLTKEKHEQLERSHALSENQGIMPLLDEFSVVACTVDACLYRILPDGVYKPDHVFLDEAGYCNVIKAMTLLGFEKPLTLLGDHKQLPPVFEGEQDLLDDPEQMITRLWKISALYLENVVSCPDLYSFCSRDPDRPVFHATQTGALTETYRFGPDLAKILARRIYGQQFSSCSENKTEILFIDAPKNPEDKKKTQTGKHRRVSHSEAECIRSLMEANLSHMNITIGIITPYRNQRSQLAKTIDQLLSKYKIDEDMEDDIVTVHQSQGREWDVVIFSITDCFDEMHFTNSRYPESLKLINTAISRARKMLILVGDAEDWKGHNEQMISELFAIGREISPNEKIVKTLQERKEPNEFIPWLENFGSLFMALSIDS